MLDFFKQVLPVGIAEVIFLPHLAKTTKKQKISVNPVNLPVYLPPAQCYTFKECVTQV